MKRNFFLDHPVFAIVISIVIVLLGVIGLVMLPVDQYPRIVPPVVKVSASYPGADAMTRLRPWPLLSNRNSTAPRE